MVEGLTTPKDIQSWKVKRIKAELGKLGLLKSGNKTELINRLSEYFRSYSSANEQTDLNDVDVDKVQEGKVISKYNWNDMPSRKEPCLSNCVSTEDFRILKEELISLTDFVRNMYENIKTIEGDHISKLEKEVDFLRNECLSKGKVIELLSEEYVSPFSHHSKKSESKSLRNSEHLENNNNGGWITVGDENKFSKNNKSPATPILEVRNKFSSLTINNAREEIKEGGDDIYLADQNMDKSNVILNKKRPAIIVNNYPETNHVRKVPPIIPGNSNYSEILKNGRRVLVMGDSLIKRVKYKEFNRVLQFGKAEIKSFPGAIINELHHYILPHLQNISPDIAIIHAGTNNLSRYNTLKQTNDEIVEELINIGMTCRKFGVNHIFFSGLCHRSSSFLNTKINAINSLLSNRCNDLNFNFIDNQSIHVDSHLWKDGVHLNDQGIEVLANNFLKHINVICSNISSLNA